MIVRFTDEANSVLREIVRYKRHHEQKPIAAIKFKSQVQSKIGALADFPDIGRVIPEFPTSNHREFLIYPYRFFYRKDAESIFIVAIWHQAQIPEEPSI